MSTCSLSLSRRCSFLCSRAAAAVEKRALGQTTTHALQELGKPPGGRHAETRALDSRACHGFVVCCQRNRACGCLEPSPTYDWRLLQPSLARSLWCSASAFAMNENAA